MLRPPQSGLGVKSETCIKGCREESVQSIVLKDGRKNGMGEINSHQANPRHLDRLSLDP